MKAAVLPDVTPCTDVWEVHAVCIIRAAAAAVDDFGCTTFLSNVGTLLSDYTASRARRQQSHYSHY